MKIYDGEMGGTVFFKDKLWFGLVDINPIAIGHCLLIPSLQVVSFDQLPEEYLADYGKYQAKILALLKSTFDCDGVSILSCNERAAGQEVPHTHTHYIPRWLGDKPLDFKKHYQYPLWWNNKNWEIEAVTEELSKNGNR